MAIFDGDHWIDTEPGDWIHVPPGGIHGFKNTSGASQDAAALLSGAPREEYLERVPDMRDATEEGRSGRPSSRSTTRSGDISGR